MPQKSTGTRTEGPGTVRRLRDAKEANFARLVSIAVTASSALQKHWSTAHSERAIALAIALIDATKLHPKK